MNKKLWLLIALSIVISVVIPIIVTVALRQFTYQHPHSVIPYVYPNNPWLITPNQGSGYYSEHP